MKISYRGDYALKLLLELAITSERGVLAQTKHIAARLDIPKKFLEQIILTLKGANYIRTIRGPKGGLKLARHPSRITLGEIIRLIDGSTSPIACVSCSAYQNCDFAGRCVFQPIWSDIRERINDVVDRITFQELARRADALEQTSALDYVI